MKLLSKIITIINLNTQKQKKELISGKIPNNDKNLNI